MNRQISLFVLILTLMSGCTSIRTTVLDRSESGHLSPNPDRALKGVPVMLKVPTHIDVHIVQIDYWTPNEATGELELMKVKNGEFPNRQVKTELKRTEQMFLVDPKRPGAGLGMYAFGFSDDAGKGYLANASYKSQDKTFDSSVALFRQISKTLGATTGADSDGDEKEETVVEDDAEKVLRISGIISTRRTIAFKRFRLNASLVDTEIQTFVDQYMNDCHKSCYVGSPKNPK